MITAYPLCWPAGWKRIDQNRRVRAKFSKGVHQFSADRSRSWTQHKILTVSQAIDRVLGEVMRLGVRDRGDIVISTNIKTGGSGRAL